MGVVLLMVGGTEAGNRFKGVQEVIVRILEFNLGSRVSGLAEGAKRVPVRIPTRYRCPSAAKKHIVVAATHGKVWLRVAKLRPGSSAYHVTCIKRTYKDP